MKKGDYDVTDRISQLPEEILLHILSFLLVKDAFYTSLVSKSWYSACRMLPSLDFSENFFHQLSEFHPEYKKIASKKLDLVHLIIRCRLEHGGCLRKLWLQLPRVPSLYWEDTVRETIPFLTDIICNVMSLIPMVASIVNENMKELAFDLGFPSQYTLPEAIYAAKSLTKLYIGGFKMDLPSAGIKFSSLKELSLTDNCLDNRLLRLLITSSPNIELLKIEGCYGFDILQIRGLLRLKQLHLGTCIENVEKIEIDAPYLQKLSLCLYTLPEYHVAAYKSLKIAELYDLPLSNLGDEFFSKFPLLETLDLSCCERLKSIRISSNCLKTLSIEHCSNLLQVEIDAPKLSSLTLIESVSFSFSLKASAVQHIYFKMTVYPDNTEWEKKLPQFLGNLNHSSAMTIFLSQMGRAFPLYVGEEVRECFDPPLYDLKEMFIEYVPVKFDPFKLLDTLLWMAPRLDILVFRWRPFPILFEFIYEENHEDEAQYPCCRSLPIKCWRCSLKRVRVWSSVRLDLFQTHYFVKLNI